MISTSLESKKYSDSYWPWVLFLIWPLLSFLYAVFNFRYKQSKVIIVLYFTLFGFTLNIVGDRKDGSRNIERYKAAESMEFNQVTSRIIESVTLNVEGKFDFYNLLVNYVFTRFTSSPRFAFAFHAFIFSLFAVAFYGFLFSQNIGNTNRLNLLPFFLLIIFVNPISNIHAIRFPIASWVYIYGVYWYLREEKNKYLIWCFVAPFIHFGLSLGLVVILLYKIIGNRHKIIIPILLMSYIFPDLLYSYFKSLDEPVIAQGSLETGQAYADEEFIQRRKANLEAARWYRRFSVPVLQFTSVISFYVISFLQRNLLKDRVCRNMLSYLMLLLTLVNFGYAFDSVGRRYFFIWLVIFSAYVYHLYIANQVTKIQWPALLVLLPSLLWVVLKLRISLEIMNPFWLIGNPLIMLFFEYDGTIL